MLFAEALETAKCFEEGVIESAAAANIGSIMGIGFPPMTGGAAQFMTGYEDADGPAQIGLGAFVARADELADDVRRPVPADPVPARPRRLGRGLPRLTPLDVDRGSELEPGGRAFGGRGAAGVRDDSGDDGGPGRPLSSTSRTCTSVSGRSRPCRGRPRGRIAGQRTALLGATAPASPRRCACWPASSRRPRASSGSRATTSATDTLAVKRLTGYCPDVGGLVPRATPWEHLQLAGSAAPARPTGRTAPASCWSASSSATRPTGSRPASATAWAGGCRSSLQPSTSRGAAARRAVRRSRPARRRGHHGRDRRRPRPRRRVLVSTHLRELAVEACQDAIVLRGGPRSRPYRATEMTGEAGAGAYRALLD